MATTILGKVGLTPKGAWAEGTAYERLDVVSYDYGSYLSLADNNTAATSDTTKWMLLVDMGDEVAKTNAATEAAKTATTNAEKVNATLSDDYKFTVTDRTGTQKTLDLASPADVADLNDRFKSYVRLRFNIDKTITVDGVKVTCPAGKIVKVYGKSITGIGDTGWSTYDPQLEWADVSHWDIRGLTTLPRFSRESLLKQLDVSGWDTSKVTNMNQSFRGLKLEYLDVSGWDTSSVTSIGCMFYNCHALASLDVSGWDTSSVTDMYCTFLACSSLTALDVSGWDTSKVTDIENMFFGCQNLASLKFGSGWGTQTSTEAKALTLDLLQLNSSGSYQLSDETWSSMLTMHDRATAGLTAMTIKIKKTANIPDGWEEQMAALGYTITKV